jgi:REP element-mobilizing transposase RayT
MTSDRMVNISLPLSPCNRTCLFGSVTNDEMEVNAAGEMVVQVCYEIQKVINGLQIDPLKIMSNHIHFIVHTKHGVGSGLCARPGE